MTSGSLPTKEEPPDIARPALPAGAVGEASLARSGLISFGGFGIAAIAGFGLTVVVGRGLGAESAGLFFVVVALMTVAGTVTKLGADTGLVWALPRCLALGRANELRSTVGIAVVPVLIASTVAAAVLSWAAPALGALLDENDPGRTAPLIQMVAPFIVVVAPTSVLLAGLRGVGDVRGFTLLQNVTLPVARCAGAATAIVWGAGVLAVLLLWASPVVAIAAVSALLLRSRLRRLAHVATDPARPGRAVRREFWRFSSARSVSAVLEVVLVWSDVLILAALTSPREAGIYAVASRFITAGTLVEAAMRVTVAPRVSHLLALDHVDAAARLNGMATTWIVVLSWPLYLCLAVMSPAALTLFGPGFDSGALSMTVLASAMLIAMATGNSQTMLLMSGRSAWQMTDKVVAVLLNVVLTLFLVPRLGMLGAAIAWSATIIVDSVIVWLQVRYLVGLRTPLRGQALAIGAASVCIGLPLALTRWLVGTSVREVLVCLVLSSVAYAAVLWRAREALALTAMTHMLRRRAVRARP